jgi:hypothetical protein
VSTSCRNWRGTLFPAQILADLNVSAADAAAILGGNLSRLLAA